MATLHEQMLALTYMPMSFSLWIGAGTTIQLARSGGLIVPNWNDLATQMEGTADITPALNANLPDRLENCHAAIGEAEFQKFLREKILERTYDAIEKAAETHNSKSEWCPKEIRQIAKLGTLANPIVSFNIEHMTSYAIARPGGPCSMRCFRTADGPKFGRGSFGNRPYKQFTRIVYHPHGLLDVAGTCVMTSSQYRSMNGTLALQMAIHAAFDSFLIIVGMSLEDEYLRSQLETYSEHIMIIWFSGKIENPIVRAWADKMVSGKKMQLVDVPSWAEFWQTVDTLFPDPNEQELYSAWHSMVYEACYRRSTAARIADVPGGDKAFGDVLNRFMRGSGESTTPPRKPDEADALFKRLIRPAQEALNIKP